MAVYKPKALMRKGVHMINVFLYCSYSGSAVGYQKAVVDERTNVVRSPKEGEIPKLVNQIWTHGGANAAAGCVNGVAYFLVKRIDYQNENKQRDEQGRKVYMNCAFTSGSTSELQQFADGFFACYQAAVKGLGDLLIVDDTEIGYTVQDFAGLRELVSSCLETGKRLNFSRIGSLEGEISFIALEGDWNYFATQNNVSHAIRPKTMMEPRAYQRMLTESRDIFSVPEPIQVPRPDKAPVAKPEEPSVQAERRVEERVTRTATKAAIDAAQKRAEAREQRMGQEVKRHGRLIKIASAVAIAAVVLTLILHSLGD